VGILGLSLVMLIFMFPETKWHRVYPGEVVQGAPENSSVLDQKGDVGHEDEEKSIAASNLVMLALSHSKTVERNSFLGRGGPSKQQFKISQAKDPRTTLWSEMWTPWELLAFPIVEFASFVVSWSASLFLTVNLTQAQNFAGPPYNYSSDVIGKFANTSLSKGG